MNNQTGNILDSIKKPDDIKNLQKKELQLLAGELRHELISNVSNNGGHLASNLGVVELTIALLNVFDMENDKIIWDVGHQSYSYKILTGRRNQFDRIRKKGGISGFPKRNESKYDHFNTGHSSTSISAALGYARAAKLKGEDFYSIAVVGDGAMTGGMAFEALNDAGASDENIIVILNDNEMSITRNVGGFAEYFSRMRSNRLYSGTKRSVKKGVERIPLVGKLISGAIHRGKSAVKYLFAQNMLFEEMGFHYLGPVDGHDLRKLNKILLDAKKIKGPVLVHAVTIKGKGYEKAEEKPDIYHGVGRFDIENGLEEKLSDSFSKALGRYLEKELEKNESIVVVTPAVTLGCGLLALSKKFPDRYFDVGIAEQHAVTLAGGMACSGLLPVVAGYSTFMQRAYDQILHDVCLMNLHVVFTLDRAGAVGGDGATHQGVYDLAYLSNMPNIKILAPCSIDLLETHIVHALYSETGPVVIRYPKGVVELPVTVKAGNPMKVNLLKEGRDCIIYSYGRMLEEAFIAAGKLTDFGISCSVADLSCLKPLDEDGIISMSKNKKMSVCIEDSVESGSCSLKIQSILANAGYKGDFRGFTLDSDFQAEGKTGEILESAGLSGDRIADEIISILIAK